MLWIAVVSGLFVIGLITVLSLIHRVMVQEVRDLEAWEAAATPSPVAAAPAPARAVA